MKKEIDWEKIVEDLGPRLFRYFCVRFSPELADDLTQETLIRLVRKFQEGKFDPSRGNLSALGFGIAHYVALEHKQGNIYDDIEHWQESLVADTDLEQSAITKDFALKVRAQMKNLSPIEQQVLALLVDRELRLEEISVILQLPLGSVKSHVFRALFSARVDKLCSINSMKHGAGGLVMMDP